jgi:hypothetical protein
MLTVEDKGRYDVALCPRRKIRDIHELFRIFIPQF